MSHKFDMLKTVKEEQNAHVSLRKQSALTKWHTGGVEYLRFFPCCLNGLFAYQRRH